MLNSYEINKETIAIIPISNNNSKVLEEENTININKYSSMIIDDSCRFFGSSYMGRHEGTKSLLGINYKSPIVVEESNEIIFFPTASPRVEDCHWISLKHVDKLEKNGLKTKILFKNGQELNLNVSYGSLENQLLRATRLQSIMRDRKIA